MVVNLDIDEKFLSIDKQLLANMVFANKEQDKYFTLKFCVGFSLVIALMVFGLLYLIERKRDSVNQFILKHDCKPIEVLRVGAIEANIIYHCGDGKQLEVTL